MPSSASRRARAAEEKAKAKLERETIILEFDYLPAVLSYQGPIIKADLTITPSHRDALVAAGQPIPAPVNCRFLIDTGADGTVVKHEFAERAGLKLINDSMALKGVGIDTTGRAYMGRIMFRQPSRVLANAVHSMYVDTQVMSATLQGNVIDGLIGRDVLQHFQLSYDGKTGKVRMRYYRPEAATP